MWHTILASSACKGAISGVASAALVDLQAFRKWQSFHEMYAYSWSLALWRWFQGAVIGGLAGAGYGGMIA